MATKNLKSLPKIRIKPLDIEYRKRWEEYHMKDDSIKDSREINWRDVVGWNDVVKITMSLANNEYEVNKKGKRKFKFFLRFRNAGRDYQRDAKGAIQKAIVIHEWCIGWSDGKKVYMTVVDFHTGKQLPDLIRTVGQCINHIHPEVVEKYNLK